MPEEPESRQAPERPGTPALPGSPALCPFGGREGLERSFASERGEVRHCRSCGGYWIPEPGSPADHARLFYSTVDESMYVDYFEPMRKSHYRQVLRRLLLSPGTTHLDVGASFGWMVEVGLELGFDSHGIEPGEAHPRSAEIARRIEHIRLDELSKLDERRWQLITIWHALEHLDDPAGAAASMAERLSDGGVLIVAVPNACGRMYRLALLLRKAFGSSRLMSELWYFHNPNLHRAYLGPDSLSELLRRAGLRVESLFTMEAFDWCSIHRRSRQPLVRAALRFLGPWIAASGFTHRENLIAIARR